MKIYPLKCLKKLKRPGRFPMIGIALQNNFSHVIQIFVIELAESGSFSNMKRGRRFCFYYLEITVQMIKKGIFKRIELGIFHFDRLIHLLRIVKQS